MRRSQNHLFEAPVDTSAAGTWVAGTRAVDRRVADKPAEAGDLQAGVDFGDHLVRLHS
jgi:hypothetical protein